MHGVEIDVIHGAGALSWDLKGQGYGTGKFSADVPVSSEVTYVRHGRKPGTQKTASGVTTVH